MKLSNKLVKLRPIRISDAERYVKWFSDQEVNKFVGQQTISLKQERVYILKSKTRKAAKVFAIETAAGIHIGSIGLHRIDNKNRSAEYGIIIGDKKFWGKGYGRAASDLILAYGFKSLKLNRIWLNVYKFNKRGIQLYRKLGFKREGVQREYVRRGNTYYNAYLMSLLTKEWGKLNSK